MWKPLFEETYVRDIGGRVRSVQSRFGHPMEYASMALPDSAHDYVWRGYNYNSRHALTRVWEYEDEPEVDDSSLVPHSIIMDAAVDNIGSNVGASPWDRIRDPQVGSLDEISNPQTGQPRWQQSSPRTAGHRLSDVNGYPISHDAMGNVLDSVAVSHEYDAFGRLVRNAGETYSYDAFGQLVVVEYSSTGEVEVLHWDGDRIIGASELNSRAPLWDAVFSPTHQDKLLEFYHHQVGEAQVPLTDHRNSVVGVWNAGQGAMGELARYDAEGLVTLLSSAEEPMCDEHDSLETVCPTPGPGGLLPFGFNSQFRSRGTGLVYMRNRWYSPRLAQFVSHDPLEYVDSSDLYAFAVFDPINKWDPFGLSGGALVGGQSNSDFGWGEQFHEEFVRAFKLLRGQNSSTSSDSTLLGMSPLQRKMLKSNLAGRDGLGIEDQSKVFNGKQYGFSATKDAAESVAVESVTALVGGAVAKAVSKVGGTIYSAARRTKALGPAIKRVEQAGANTRSKAIELARRSWDKLNKLPGGSTTANTIAATVRVGRWMSREEAALMKSTGRVQGSAGGITHVTNPANPQSFKASKPGSIFVEFDVPASSVAKGGRTDWGIISGPNSPRGRLAAKRGQVLEFPEATNIHVIE